MIERRNSEPKHASKTVENHANSNEMNSVHARRAVDPELELSSMHPALEIRSGMDAENGGEVVKGKKVVRKVVRKERRRKGELIDGTELFPTAIKDPRTIVSWRVTPLQVFGTSS